MLQCGPLHAGAALWSLEEHKRCVLTSTVFRYPLYLCFALTAFEDALAFACRDPERHAASMIAAFSGTLDAETGSCLLDASNSGNWDAAQANLMREMQE